MKKIYDWSVKFYTTGGFLKHVFLEASTKAEAIAKVRKEYKVIEMYSIRCTAER